MSTDKKHSIDKLFHESLQGQKIEPGNEVWNSLSGHIPARGGNRTLYYVMGTVAVALVALVLYTGMFGIFKTEPFTATETEAVEKKSGSAEDSAMEPEDVAETTQRSAIEPQHTAIEEAESPDEITGSQQAESKQIIKLQSDLLIDDPVAKDPVETYNRTDYARMSSRVADEAITPDGSVEDIAHKSGETPLPRYNMDLENAYVRQAEILYGAGFSPAVNMYPDGQNRNDFSFELIVDYERAGFFIEGGIGANYATESVKYGINYTSYDSVGYFVSVNSFTYDPGKPDSIRFQTSLKNIYDSINHYRIEENTNKYAYLQIPLRFGYRIFQNNNFSLDLKAGIIFSWQIMKDVPDIPYGGSDAEIEVLRQYPDRLNVNWQYSAAVAMNYHITKQLRFTIEPFYRQYLKSVYTTDSEYSARSPYAVGMRAGLYIKF